MCQEKYWPEDVEYCIDVLVAQMVKFSSRLKIFIANNAEHQSKKVLSRI